MRTWLLLILGVLLPSPVFGQGLGTLAAGWEDCRGQPGALLNRAFACDAAVPKLRLVVSFKPAVTIPDFAGLRMRLVVAWGGSDWWDAKPGGCREGAITVADPASVSCPSPYGQSFTIQPISYVTESKYPGHLEFDVTITRTTPIEIAASAGDYVGAIVEIAAADLSTIGSCGGCTIPVCAGVGGAWVLGASGTIGHLDTSSPEVLVNWQGGITSCYGVTPARARTWGEIKTLYR